MSAPKTDTIPTRDIFEDGGLWRAIEETKPMSWLTLATFATAAEARAFLEGVRYGEASDPRHAARADQDRTDLAHRTYAAAVEAYRSKATR